MRVGILTHWWGQHNYGQKLQLYALQTYLKHKGHEPELLKFHKNSHWWYLYLFNRRLKTFLYCCYGKVLKRNWANRDMDSFLRNKIDSSPMLINKDRLNHYCKKFQLLITGSDQVWAKYLYRNKSGDFLKECLDAFTLDLPSSAIKISYAASLGHYFPDSVDEKKFINKIKALDMVSVRENNLHTYLLGHGVNNTLVPDPVFLLENKDYILLCGETFNSPRYRKKIFQYSLGHESYIDAEACAKFLSSRLQSTYTYVCGNNADRPVPETDFPTIEEWLSYIGNSELVITNSFHCVAYCVIFHTDFYYIPLKVDGMESRDERIPTLLEMLGISNREVTTIDELKCAVDNPKKIDWHECTKRLSDYINIGKIFLDKALALARNSG